MQQLWYSGAPKFKEKVSKSIIHSFTFGKYNGLAINPYQGCHHRCAYCYATYEWSPEFYDLIYVKRNAARILDEQLFSWDTNEIGPVMVGSATDSYQPAELRYGLTRECVKVLQKHNVPYYVFTKSAAVLRDIDLHANYSNNCCIIWSVTTTDEAVRRIIEPGTPPAARLFDAIKRFSDRGVSCGINVDPIMPLVNDGIAQFNALIQAARDAGGKHIIGSVLRMRQDIWERIKCALLKLQIPDFERVYTELYNISKVSSSSYWSAEKGYQSRTLANLFQQVELAGMLPNFPDHLGKRRLKRSMMGQLEIGEFFDWNPPA